jgi:predicted nucleotidyltransferase
MTDHNLVKDRKKYVNALGENLSRVVNQLRQMPNVHKVMLFGSYAAGKRDLFTDLDIIVVMDTKEEFIQRAGKLHQMLQVGVDMDLLVYTPDEFEIMKEKPFLQQALEHGRVLYEKISS